MEILKYILGWSEVWALFIPIAVLWNKRQQPAYLKPVIIYVFAALVMNLFADIIANFKKEFNFPLWLQTNNYVYNIQSIARFYLFWWFFLLLRQPFLLTVKKIIPVIFLVFIAINFSSFPFSETFFNFDLVKGRFSSRLLATEAALLLFFCLQYFLFRLKEDNPHRNDEPDFWVVTGLSIYVVLNFFIFLFQNSLEGNAAKMIWRVHDVIYIIFCLFLAKAFRISKYERNV